MDDLTATETRSSAHWPGSRMTASSALLALIFCSWVEAPAASDSLDCGGSKIVFETSALEQIVHDPQQVLDAEAEFWSTEDAQVYTTRWAEYVEYDLDLDDWRRELEVLADMGPGERARHPLLQMAETIVAARDTFLTYAIPHLCSFFPEGTRMDVPIHFTAFIPPRSFAMGGIVINVSAQYWKGNPDNILNNLIHELGHAGYSRCRELRSELPLGHEPLYGMLETLQNEGICTYVGYRARTLFSAPDEVDYELLDTPKDVDRLRAALNLLLGLVGAVSGEELKRQSWQTGVLDRAYYVTGAHIARVIDSALGRDALIGSLVEGPAAYVRVYNSLVPDSQAVHVPDAGTISAREAGREREE